MLQFAGNIVNKTPSLRRGFNRLFYQFLAGIDTDGEVTLMNYGFVPSEPNAAPIPLPASDEMNRLCLQLYHHVASAVDLRDKDALEVGSGRGGGAAYMRRTFSPRAMTGVDYSERAVAFCQRAHQLPGLSFVHGDAESLPFEDSRFDAAINLESSHCYGSMRRFLAETFRVLKPGGQLSWADFRSPWQESEVDADMSAVGFEIAKSATITPNVLASMAQQGERYRALIDSKVPRFARGIFYHYAGVDGRSLVLDKMRAGDLVYLRRVAVKPGQG